MNGKVIEEARRMVGADGGAPLGAGDWRGGRLPLVGAVIVLSVLCALASLAALVAVATPARAAQLFTNPSSISIPGSGLASPYPSEIAVGGTTGPITDMTVTLHRFGHTWPNDVDIVLVSPSGKSVVLMSDACGSADIEDFTWVFSDSALGPMSGACGGFVYKPTDISIPGYPDRWPRPAPPGNPRFKTLGAFDGEVANGTWRLFVVDDGANDSGDIEGGWSLSIETRPDPDTTAPTVISTGPTDNATGIGLVANVGARFSEPVRTNTPNPNTFELFEAGTTTRLGASVSYDVADRRALLNPNANLKPNTRYRAVVSPGVRDIAGNGLDQDPSAAGNQAKVWFFTTRK